MADSKYQDQEPVEGDLDIPDVDVDERDNGDENAGGDDVNVAGASAPSSSSPHTKPADTTSTATTESSRAHTRNDSDDGSSSEDDEYRRFPKRRESAREEEEEEYDRDRRSSAGGGRRRSESSEGVGTTSRVGEKRSYDESTPSTRESNSIAAIKLLIPTQLSGQVIGKRGSRVRELQDTVSLNTFHCTHFPPHAHHPCHSPHHNHGLSLSHISIILASHELLLLSDWSCCKAQPEQRILPRHTRSSLPHYRYKK